MAHEADPEAVAVDLDLARDHQSGQDRKLLFVFPNFTNRPLGAHQNDHATPVVEAVAAIAPVLVTDLDRKYLHQVTVFV